MIKEEILMDYWNEKEFKLLTKDPLDKVTNNISNYWNLTDKEESIEGLSQMEFEVLKIAEEILKLKRYSVKFDVSSKSQIQKYPILEKLYSKCIAKLMYSHGYSKEDIFQAIQSLENKNWIISNQRRTKEEILKNEKHRIVHDFIRRNPGIHASDKKIETELNITRTTFLKYIITLENFELIRSTKFGNRLHFFSIEFPEIFETLSILFLNPLVSQIIIEILKNSQISIKQLSRNLHLFPNAIRYHLKKLQDSNIVFIKSDELRKQYFIVNLPLLESYLQITRSDEMSELSNLIKD